MTRWTIDGRGDTGTRAFHNCAKGKLEYNVQRRESYFWISDVTYPDGSRTVLDAMGISEASAHARCESHAANSFDARA
jgi:hypothetical protein